MTFLFLWLLPSVKPTYFVCCLNSFNIVYSTTINCSIVSNKENISVHDFREYVEYTKINLLAL